MNVALEGMFTVNGIEATPGFQLVKASVKGFTPEWAEEITTVPAAAIRHLTGEYVARAHIGETINIGGMPMSFTPTAIQYQRGAYQHTLNGPRGDLVACILNELVGIFEVPDGINFMLSPNPIWNLSDVDGVLQPKGEAVPEAWE